MPEIDWEEVKRLPMLPGEKPDERVAHLLQMVGHLQDLLNRRAAGPWHYPPELPPEPAHPREQQSYLVMIPHIYNEKPWPGTQRYLGRGDWSCGKALCWAEIREPKEESDD